MMTGLEGQVHKIPNFTSQDHSKINPLLPMRFTNNSISTLQVIDYNQTNEREVRARATYLVAMNYVIIWD